MRPQLPVIALALVPAILLAFSPRASLAGPLFGPPQTFELNAPPIGIGPTSIAIQDLNADGMADMVVTTHDSSTVSVLLGNGDGTFGPKRNYATDLAPWSVTIGDLNSDGRPDLVVANAGTLSILLGNGDGTFGPRSDIDVVSHGFWASVAIGDLNADSHPDLVVAGSAQHISVLLGNGDGTFMPRTSYATGNGAAFWTAIGDLNHDGRPDLAVANYGGGGSTVSVLLGNGDGTFQPQVPYGTGPSPSAVAIGDLNHDGHPDLVSTNVGDNTVSVLLGHGDGTFGPFAGFPTGPYPFSFALANLNADEDLDVVTANQDTLTASVLLGHGDGTFGARTEYAAGGKPQCVAVGDLNGDHEPDLLTGNILGVTEPSTISALLNLGPGASPDCSHASADPSLILQRNHKFVPVSITGVTGPEGDPVTISVTRVTQDEPVGSGRSDDDGGEDSALPAAAAGDASAIASVVAPEDHAGHGDGHDHGNTACGDAVLDRSGAVSLRAERMGKGNGRVYTIWFTTSDEQGGSCDGSVQVCVPHDNRGQHDGTASCVDDGQNYNSLGPCSGDHGLIQGVASRITLKPGARVGSTMSVEYSLPAAGEISLAVYDVSGRRVASVAQGTQEAGVHQASWDSHGVAHGVYFYRLRVGSASLTRSVLVLK
jgi:hypothetical protein